MPDITQKPKSALIANKTGFIAGIICFLAILLIPFNLAAPIKKTLSVLVICAIWWSTEAISIYATALLPGLLLLLFGIIPLGVVLREYAHRLIFLFLGGFLIARAMMKWRIDHRIALKILAKAGTDARLLLLYFMIATAAISAFVSNTATAAMMLPIGMSVLVNIRNEDKADYGKALMLGIAYAASIGGVATLVGTPPNVILAGFVKSLLGKTITFLDWLKVGLPFAIIMLPITWKCLLINCKIKELEFDEENRLEKQLRVMGPLNSGQKIVIFVFALAALLWITQSFWHLIPLRIAAVIQSHVDDSAIAIICALLLFIIPTDIKEQRFPLDLGDMKHISWGILLLFGGGLCLGKGLFESGTAMWIAGFIPLSNGAHLILLMLLTIVVVSFLTEFASNTAVANMMIPILIAASHSLNVHPFCLAIPAAVACSIAFMLPISTPPNAIVYGSGYVSIQEMFKKGLLIHLIGVLVLVLLAYFLMGKVFGIIPV